MDSRYSTCMSRLVYLWRTQVQRQAFLPLSPLQTPYYSPPYRLHALQPLSHKACCSSWRHLQGTKTRGGRKGWLLRVNQRRHRLGFHTSAFCFNTSASRWSGLSQHMSRIRSTLDSVSKAVSGTHTDLLSKITRLRPASAVEAAKEVEGSHEVKVAPSLENAATPELLPTIPASTSSPIPTTVATAAPSTSNLTTVSVSSPEDATPTPMPIVDAPVTTIPVNTGSDATPASLSPVASVRELREKRLRRVATTVKNNATATKKVYQAKAPETTMVIHTKPPESNRDQGKSPETVSKPTTSSQLFHASSFSVNLDETFNSLAHHVNAYFKTSEKSANGKQDGDAKSSPSSPPSDLVSMSESAAAPVPPSPTPKKGSILGQYLSYSGPTVQAFVGNYLAPLVPVLRSEPKMASLETEKCQTAEGPEKPLEVVMSKEQRADEEKAKRLLLQRERIIARVSVDNRTRALVQALHRASDVRLYINRVEDLSYHLMEFPETRRAAIKEKVVPCLLRLRQAGDPKLKAAVRQALALVGYNNPVKGRGIRVLSIDGGGTRGLVALQTLHKLEALTNKPISQLFDYICGVSTGAILGFMLGVFQIPLDECDVLYRKLGSDVFKQNLIVGTVKMGWNHAYYDAEPWENILKERMGLELMVETSRNPNCPKVAAVSTIVNRGTPLKAYVFRNYSMPPGIRSHYLGSCQHKLWEALRASSAAPGYFQEFSLGNDLHQDGGLLINNPTALAIHECQCIWPNTPLECVVSLGTGRIETPGKNSSTYTSLKTKLTNVISSATDTEEVHTMLDALLPPNTYYRFNPYMVEEIALDESRSDKLNLLQAEGLRYLERNEDKLKKVAGILTREKTSVQRMVDWAKLKADMYDRVPSFSFRL